MSLAYPSTNYLKGSGLMDPYTNPHTKLDHDLAGLRDDILRLGKLTDQAIQDAVQALQSLDLSLAHQVIKKDESINAFRYHIEHECYKMLSLQQPTARDMRSIITAIHIAVELERIADHAAGIAKLALLLQNVTLLKPMIEMVQMMQIAREMLKNSLEAYVNWNTDLADATFKRDDAVDALDKQAADKLLALMLADRHNITDATYLLWVAHNLERICDRITNICERIAFMVTGEISVEEEG